MRLIDPNRAAVLGLQKRVADLETRLRQLEKRLGVVQDQAETALEYSTPPELRQ